MILNLSQATGETLLQVVDMCSTALRKQLPQLAGRQYDDALVFLQQLGVAKHRLEWNLDYPNPFGGPHDWGYPIHAVPSVPGRWPKSQLGVRPMEPTSKRPTTARKSGRTARGGKSAA